MNYRLVCALIMFPVALVAEPTTNTPVVLVRDATAITGFTANEAKVQAMISTGIKTLTGQTNEAAAWKQFAGPDDLVAIKINTASAPLQATRRPVVNAIVQGLLLAGVKRDRIIVFDREMNDTGYAGEHEIAIIPDGWDANAVYENKIVGKLIWGDFQFGRQDSISTRSHFPKLLKTATKIINVPVMQEHEACGLSGCLYNLSLGLVDNARRLEMYGQRGDPWIAEILSAPALRGKVVLNIMDALVAGYAGGPAFKPQYSWPAGCLYFSRDPVAVDALALEQLEIKRKEANLPAITEQASHVKTAEKFGLGRAERSRIALVEVKP